jgi:CspA family cold shock protein
MNYRDKMLTCEQCGSQFVFTVTEQRKMAERGAELVEPEFCPRCRTAEEPGVEPIGVKPIGVEPIGVKPIGQVKWFDAIKGWGFITKANGEDIFVHQSGVKGYGTLQEGQRVEFQIEQTPKGAAAVEVVPLPMDE